MKWIRLGAGWPWKRQSAPVMALGLYRGTQEWRLLQLVRGREGGLRVHAAGVLAVRDAADEGRPGAEPEGLRLRAWMGDCGVVASTVVAGLPRSALRLWRMQVPAGLDAEDMEHMALLDAQGRHGLSGEAWCVDFGVLGPAARMDEGVELLVAAAPRAEVEGWQQGLHSAGLPLQMLEVAAHAAKAAVLRAWRCQAGEGTGCHCIVLWEEEGATLLWMLDGVLLEEQGLEVRETPELAAGFAHHCRVRGVELQQIWLAVDVPMAEAGLLRLYEALRQGIGMACRDEAEPAVQWLQPWCGMAFGDAGVHERLLAQASGWWTVCGLALRGVDAWSC
ncbi:MAG: pilus assembly protein PilM [Brachymonas denitrificans]|uniref:pilus assembly protein PilM n=1 Tax=Brachymonas denitrificans TaxID=28220 RepID=UPI00352E87CE